VPRRVFIHVGCPKTGTSYLQSILRHNQGRLCEHGLLTPLNDAHHYALSLQVREVPRYAGNEELQRRVGRLRAAVRDFGGDVLLTHELLAPATAQQAEALLESLAPAEVHVVITARDLARQIPAEWQQHIKSGYTGSLPEFVAQVQAHKGAGRWFWSVQDVSDIARRWAGSLRPQRVHVVTVPPRGRDPEILWDRFAGVLGIPVGLCRVEDTRGNESLGVVEVELLRRANRIRRELGEPADRATLKRLALGMLGGRAGARRFGYDPRLHPWVVETGAGLVAALRGCDYHIAGNLDDLLPARVPEIGADPADVAESDLLDASIDALMDAAAQLCAADAERAELRRLLGDAELESVTNWERARSEARPAVRRTG
jgi:hypothetical protein